MIPVLKTIVYNYERQRFQIFSYYKDKLTKIKILSPNFYHVAVESLCIQGKSHRCSGMNFGRIEQRNRTVLLLHQQADFRTA